MHFIKLIKNFIYLFLARGLDFIIPLVLLPTLISRLGVEGYGLIAMSMSLSLFLGTIIQYGFNLSATREVAHVEYDKLKLNKVFNQYLQVSHTLGIFVATLFSFLIFIIDINFQIKLIYFFSILYILFYSLIPTWLYQGLEKFKFIALCTSISKIFFVTSVLFFIKDERDVVYVNFLNFIFVFLLYVFSILHILYKLDMKIKICGFKFNFIVLKKDFYVFVNQLVTNFYNNFSVFYLGILHGSSSAGLFSAAMTVAEIFLSIIKLIVNVIYPFLVKNKDKFNFTSYIFVGVVSISLIFYNILIGYIAEFLSHDQGYIVSEYARVLSLSTFFASIYLIYGLTFNLINLTEKKLTLIVVKVSLFSSLLMFAIVPFYGVYASIAIIFLSRFMLAFYSLKNYKLYKMVN